MDVKNRDELKQIDSLLAAGHLSWFLGAGISLGAGIPLMGSLTERVLAKADVNSNVKPKEILNAIKSLLPDNSNIEQILSHLGDFAAIAERSKDKKARIGTADFELTDLHEVHVQTAKWIAEIVRWGYRPSQGTVPEKTGSRGDPIVTINDHLAFVKALFNRNQAGLSERRTAIKLFTTNYDTLLEDALAVSCFSCWDGFSGGAVAYRCHRYGQDEPETGYNAHVIKIHGSIDWHLGTDDRIWRVREGDLYPEKTTRVLIYPQSTKYLATQRDPFSAQFDLFRRSLSKRTENVLAICGYSFGDEHINQEIEIALQHPDNKTTILVFSSNLKPILEKWRKASWSKRLYIITEAGLYVGSDGPLYIPTAGNKLDWWTFAGVTKILNDGAEAYV